MKLSILFATTAFGQNGSNSEASVAKDDVCMRDGQEVPCELKTYRSGAGEIAPGTDGDRAERRYNDLHEMAIKLWAKNGLKGKKNGFDERKYWAYGCHCFMLGDRPMSEMGMGKPTDALDNKCKAFKDCHKCVREKHGSDCIGEMRKYTWKWSTKKNTFESVNQAGSCLRELFECDKKLVYDTWSQKDVFDDKYHAFWSSKDGSEAFDNKDPANCPSNGGVPVVHMCCGGHNQPYHWIGLNKHQCCATDDGNSGDVLPAGDTCDNGNFIAP